LVRAYYYKNIFINVEKASRAKCESKPGQPL
jgi:hypothetical protein